MSKEQSFTTASVSSRVAWLWALAVTLAALLWLHGPIAQWADYHSFADQRSWGDLPNVANVWSNIAFLAVGAWALWQLRPARCSGPALCAWRVFAVALACTAAGSAIYHASPSNATLVGDRLPIAWACAALLCAFLCERVNPRWGRTPVLAGALAGACLAVAYWWATEQSGHGDLRPYLAFQLLPMLLVPAALLLKLPPTFAAAAAARAWWTVLAFYAVAKLTETADHAIFVQLGIVSGHTLKHLLAAAGAAALLASVVRKGRRVGPFSKR